MGHCIHNSFGGTCYFYEEDATYEEGHIKNIAMEYGFTIDKGYCVVEDDECPEDTCGQYETDFREDDEETEDEELVAFHEHIDMLQKNKE